MARTIGATGLASKRAWAIRLAIEERLKKSLPDKMMDLIEKMEECDQFAAYQTLLPYCYPRLQIQAIVDAGDMGVETEAGLEAKRKEWEALQTEKMRLKSA